MIGQRVASRSDGSLTANVLDVEHLAVEFGRTVVLRDVTFAVPRGSSLAIIGPNGSGKTVLFKALIGAIAYRGRVRWVPGTRIGYVPQKLDIERDLPLTGLELLRAKAKVTRVEPAAIAQVIELVRLRQDVAGKLRQAILHGSPGPGERLVERKLAAQFGASVPVIREALVQLEAEGFVTKSPNSSSCVTQYSPEDVEQTFALRKVLEGYAMEEATRRATPEQIQSLDSRYLDMLDAARSGDSMLFLRSAYSFKQYTWEIAGNRFLAATLERLIQPQFAFLAIRLHTGKTLDLIQDAYLHLPLLEAIKSKDVEGSRQTTKEVLDEMSRRTRAYAVTQSGERAKEALRKA